MCKSRKRCWIIANITFEYTISKHMLGFLVTSYYNNTFRNINRRTECILYEFCWRFISSLTVGTEKNLSECQPSWKVKCFFVTSPHVNNEKTCHSRVPVDLNQRDFRQKEGKQSNNRAISMISGKSPPSELILEQVFVFLKIIWKGG